MSDALKNSDRELVRAKINTETAKIPWQDLQRFFASGKTLLVSNQLDLVDAAYALHEDDSKQVAEWIDQQQLVAVSADQAKRWVEDDSLVWAVVVKPWVLVQDR